MEASSAKILKDENFLEPNTLLIATVGGGEKEGEGEREIEEEKKETVLVASQTNLGLWLIFYLGTYLFHSVFTGECQ